MFVEIEHDLVNSREFRRLDRLPKWNILVVSSRRNVSISSPDTRSPWEGEINCMQVL